MDSLNLVRPLLSFAVLAAVKLASLVFFRHRVRWIGEVPDRPWADLRLIVALNHTSLFEPIYAGAVPWSFLWDLARRGVVPAADKTMDRPFVGRFLRILARAVVSITREPDHTWEAVLRRISADSVVVIFPEGRMKRADGLDSQGQPMTVRGGVADILHTLEGGRMLIAYLEGLHHVQVPGQRFPNLFKTIGIAFELVDIAEYRRENLARVGEEDFKRCVRADLERRRDEYCVPPSR